MRDCDIDCGDRDRGWFAGVMVTAPLIPLGAVLVTRAVRPGAVAGLGRVVCMLGAAAFLVIGLGVAAVGVGALVDVIQRHYPVNLDDPGASRREAIVETVIWMAGSLWCFAVALGLLAVRRRLPRRYPSREWPPSGR